MSLHNLARTSIVGNVQMMNADTKGPYQMSCSFSIRYRTYSRGNISIGIPLAAGIYLRGGLRRVDCVKWGGIYMKYLAIPSTAGAFFRVISPLPRASISRQ